MFKILIMNYKTIEPGQDDMDRRLDRVIRKAFPELSLGEIYKFLRKGKIKVNNYRKKPDYRLKTGDLIQISDFIGLPSRADIKNRNRKSGENGNNTTESIEGLDIIVETGDLILINKPSGIVVHGNNSLTAKVSDYLRDRIPASLSFSPGPLHRLDTNTSGVITFGKSLEGARDFSRLLRENRIDKYYLCVMTGKTKPEGLWEDMLTRSGGISRIDTGEKGKPAVLSYKTLASNNEKSFVLVKLHTGRTHQIRTQAAGHGHALAGDFKYGGGGRSRAGYLLHAWLILPHEEEFPPLPVEAPLPRTFFKAVSTEFRTADIESILQFEKKKIFSDLEESGGKYRMGR